VVAATASALITAHELLDLMARTDTYHPDDELHAVL
jgi:hypothetical protein